MESRDGKHIFGTVKVGEKGQIVIPQEARELYDIKAKDTLVVLGDENGIAMLKAEEMLKFMEGIFGAGKPIKPEPEGEE